MNNNIYGVNRNGNDNNNKYNENCLQLITLFIFNFCSRCIHVLLGNFVTNKLVWEIETLIFEEIIQDVQNWSSECRTWPRNGSLMLKSAELAGPTGGISSISLLVRPTGCQEWMIKQKHICFSRGSSNLIKCNLFDFTVLSKEYKRIIFILTKKRLIYF